ncbi:hypothetical protein YC2023_099245 [Brassica napus]
MLSPHSGIFDVKSSLSIDIRVSSRQLPLARQTDHSSLCTSKGSKRHQKSPHSSNSSLNLHEEWWVTMWMQDMLRWRRIN